ncbi:GNAT family N-acetyltransferase [Pseudoduganella rhizocola]|uniref:GNAT family N-acetyltransferase n=1 Tax=Pseudoduganella rhizocola TaxID=3382643 RepID=UPI0038B5BD81
MRQTTSRLVLRPPAAGDLDQLFRIYSDPAVHRFSPRGPLTQPAQAETLLAAWMDHWQRKAYGMWAISACDAPGQLIGFGGVASYRYLDEERENLGYRFAEAAWGRGYATELARFALEFALGELALPEVFALVRPAHAASIRVLEKAGMARIGELDDVPGQPASHVYRKPGRGPGVPA